MDGMPTALKPIPRTKERTYEQGEGHAVAGKKKERQSPG